MPKNMVVRDPNRPISVIHHHDKAYRPNKKGIFEIDDAHVEDMRSHGLKLEGEAAELKDAQSTIKDRDAEIAELKARLAKLEAGDKK